MEIKTIDDIKQIAVKTPDEVTFNLPFLDNKKNEEWSIKFNNTLKDCGCSSGQQYLLYSTPVYIISIVLLISFTSLTKSTIIILFITALIITGVVGKIAGIIQRNRKIKNLSEQFCSENNIEKRI